MHNIYIASASFGVGRSHACECRSGAEHQRAVDKNLKNCKRLMNLFENNDIIKQWNLFQFSDHKNKASSQ